MKRRVQDMDIDNKTVILRCDFNVPIQNGEILDDSKIRLSLETIEYLQDHECKIVILSHLGKVKSEEDKLKNTLEPVAARLNELLGTPISFSKQCRNIGLASRINAMSAKDIMLLQNTRHEDFPKKLESGNDTQLAEYWANLGEVYINDAFGSLHRAHASTSGIAKFLPNGIGFLVQQELEALDQYVLNAEHPFTVIMGGSKVEDKLQIIEKLLPKCDYLLLGGGLANSYLSALGFNVGFIADELNPETLQKLQAMMLANKDKIMLPLDVTVGSSYDKKYVNYKLVDQIENNEIIYDIGTRTIQKYKTAIDASKTVFVNGTVGVYEDERFANGTKELFKYLSKSKSNVIVGGGDSVSAARTFGYGEKFTYLSSGGGASLEYIAHEDLIALDSIDDEVITNEVSDS